MYKYILVLILFISCSPKVVEHTTTKIEYRDFIIHDTAYIEIPKESIINTTTDSVSVLETSMAISEAIISNGFLRHTLSNKPQVLSAPVEVHITDTLYKYITETKFITSDDSSNNVKLSWWQRVRLDTYYILLAMLLLIVLVRYKGFIWKFIKSLL